MLIPVTDEQAKAIADTAKLGTEMVKAAGGVAGYLAKAFGSIPEDLIGLAGGDWLNAARQRNLRRLEENTAKMIEAAGPARLTEPSLTLLVPILQGAAGESRDELQMRWAALLANAATDGGRRVRRNYIDAVARMEPVDAVVLEALGTLPDFAPGMGMSHRNRVTETIRDMQTRMGVSGTDFTVAQLALTDLGCMRFTEQAQTWLTTPFGRGLLRSIQRPPDSPGA